MKIFRLLAAGVLVLLLAALVLARTRLSDRPPSPPPREHGAGSAERGTIETAKSEPIERGTPNTERGTVPDSGLRPPHSNTAFEDWARAYAKADAGQRAALLADSETRVKERRAEMAELIRANPEEALARALPYSLRKQLPESILSRIEQPISGRGEVRPVYYTPLPGREKDVPRTEYEVVLNKTTYKTF